VITMPRLAALDAARPRLEAMLEQEYEQRTEALAALGQRRRRRATPDLEATTTAARAALADVALALRRMAEGRYGTCETCTGDIELDRLELLPSARCCRACAPLSAA